MRVLPVRLVVGSVLLATVAVIAVPDIALAASARTLVFTGQLSDEKGAPVAGIFWFRFALHRGRSDKKMLWSEELYVAVDKGSYRLELGRERPLPQTLDLTSLFLSAAVDGVEVQRVSIDASMVAGTVPAGEPGAAAAAGGCDSCKSAERAADSERLAGMSPAQLMETLGRKQVELGATSHFTSPVGSGDGTPFRLTCPPGYVVTGIKGKADDRISNLQLVCSPLETR
jgi:hypothetical protein